MDPYKKERKKVSDDFKKFLDEEFEDPENSDVLIPKQNKPDDKDKKKYPQA